MFRFFELPVETGEAATDDMDRVRIFIQEYVVLVMGGVGCLTGVDLVKLSAGLDGS
ncbi:hypothetical protein [Paludifilum halophilum]|uniref:hypothetical protein n=1 Tax=Paludifilum halophilum TaxID=1642702 RepID=UPI00146D34F1|nr:hypothetical protein [Paludifilum halophilum]